MRKITKEQEAKLLAKYGTWEKALEALGIFDNSPEGFLARLRVSGYLDTSFEGRESHTLNILPLTREEALAQYEQSGGKTWVYSELEKNMPYTTPKAETLEVATLNFKRYISSEDAIKEMDALGVRPLTYEELIQYGINHPEHQKANWLAGLGTKHTLGGSVQAPGLGFSSGGRSLDAVVWGVDWGGSYRFLVVRK